MVTYHPPENVLRLLEIIHPQVSQILVIDNASHDVEAIEAAVRALPNAELIRNPENVGLARALNQGCELARKAGAAWVLCFDQDTRPLPNLVSTLTEALASHPHPERVGVIGANHYDERGKIVHALRPGKAYREVDFVITSGSLLSLAIVGQVGPFRGDLFIDWVDIEFCWRLKSHNLVSLLSAEPAMYHMWGEPYRFRILGRELMVSNYSSLRRYYYWRNGVYLTTRYFSRLRRECLFGLYDVCVNIAMAVLIERDRINKIRAAVLGVIHGLVGQLGPAPRGTFQHQG